MDFLCLEYKIQIHHLFFQLKKEEHDKMHGEVCRNEIEMLHL